MSCPSGALRPGVPCDCCVALLDGGDALLLDSLLVGRFGVLAACGICSSDFEGGEFVTWRGGGRFPVVHDTLCRGDAVLFHSEKLHNVNIVSPETDRARDGDRQS